MENVLTKDPFIVETHRAKKFFLLPSCGEIFKDAHFGERFVTPFGTAWEKLAVVPLNMGLDTALPVILLQAL